MKNQDKIETAIKDIGKAARKSMNDDSIEATSYQHYIELFSALFENNLNDITPEARKKLPEIAEMVLTLYELDDDDDAKEEYDYIYYLLLEAQKDPNYIAKKWSLKEMLSSPLVIQEDKEPMLSNTSIEDVIAAAEKELDKALDDYKVLSNTNSVWEEEDDDEIIISDMDAAVLKTTLDDVLATVKTEVSILERQDFEKQISTLLAEFHTKALEKNAPVKRGFSMFSKPASIEDTPAELDKMIVRIIHSISQLHAFDPAADITQHSVQIFEKDYKQILASELKYCQTNKALDMATSTKMSKLLKNLDDGLSKLSEETQSQLMNTKSILQR